MVWTTLTWLGLRVRQMFLVGLIVLYLLREGFDPVEQVNTILLMIVAWSLLGIEEMLLRRETS